MVRPSQARDSNHLLLRNGDGSVVDYWSGRYGDRILVGDWNADGAWTLRETHAPDSPVASLSFGRYLVGDRDGDGDFTPGAHRAGTFWLRNSAGGGRSEVRVRVGRRNDLGVVGDWNGNGTWTPGVLRRGSRWYLKDSLSGAAASAGLKKQTPGTPVVGDWDNLPSSS